MSRKSFENFGLAADKIDDPTVAASRYRMQKESERLIFPELLTKLDLQPTDTFLDIGCNVGTLLLPCSFVVREATGIDHEKCLCRLKDEYTGIKNVSYRSGNFLDLDINKKFDKILIYSVLQYLNDKQEVFKFVDKALSLLKINGILLIGDLPNRDRERRFYSSLEGERWKKKFTNRRERDKKVYQHESIVDVLPPEVRDETCVQITDALVCELILHTRNMGYESFLMPQSKMLPFGSTRDDILIRHEHKN